MSLSVYLIGPISGLSYDECMKHFIERKEKLISYGFRVFHPMLGKEYLRNELNLRAEGYTNPISTNHAITTADFWRVDKSDILFADFTPSPKFVSIGTIAEMSRGFSKEKLIITVLPKENIHRHAFVLEMSSIIFETVEEALNYFKNYKDECL